MAAAQWSGTADRGGQAITAPGRDNRWQRPDVHVSLRQDAEPHPRSYDDVLTNATAQNAADFAGYFIRGKATNPVVADFLPILWSFGGDVFDDNWNVVLDNDTSLSAAIKFLVDKLKPVAQADPANTDAADRDQLMATGQGYQSSVWPGEIAGIVHRRRGLEGHRGKVALHARSRSRSERQWHRHDGQLDARRIPSASKNQQPRPPISSSAMLQARNHAEDLWPQNNGIPITHQRLDGHRADSGEPVLPGPRAGPSGTTQLAAADRPVERRRRPSSART